VFHFVSLLVVAGLGLDYGLFASEPGSEELRRDTRHALNACVASTCATFGVLAFSAIPVLNAIGSTVTVGCVACWLLSRLGAAPALRRRAAT
jgi:predicted exporter